MIDAREKLDELGLKPVRGQNFLTSETSVKALVEAGEVENKKVLEIGPGLGAITKELEGRAEKVYAVEKDTVLSQYLKRNFDGDVEIINENILEYDIPEVDRCVSNLPFQISSEVIELLGRKQIQSTLILQKELAEKAVRDPGESDYGRFTLMVNYFFVPVKLQDISSESYYPEPEVDTSVLKLYPNKDRHGVENREQFFEMVKALFTHKRKKVRNAFVDSRHILEISKEDAKQLRDSLPHSEIRVINLDVRKVADIAEFFSDEH